MGLSHTQPDNLADWCGFHLNMDAFCNIHVFIIMKSNCWSLTAETPAMCV